MNEALLLLTIAMTLAAPLAFTWTTRGPGDGSNLIHMEPPMGPREPWPTDTNPMTRADAEQRAISGFRRGLLAAAVFCAILAAVLALSHVSVAP